MHTINSEQIIRAPISRVWDFFSKPENLNELTPPDMRFIVLSKTPEKMYRGQLIHYKIRIALLMWSRWVTEIRHYEHERYFVDEQRFGPYTFWYHEHRFFPEGDTVRMTDTVHYIIGWGILGKFLNRWWIRRKLERIFVYRRNAVERLFHQIH